MLKHLRSTIASLLAAVLLVSALTVPAAADTGAVKDTSFNHDIEQVQDIQVINRGLHVSYAVTNQNDRAAIISALNALTVAPMRKERGEEDGLRLLTVLMTNGDRYNYWCYEDDVLQSDGGWQANGRQLDGLYAAMSRCQQTYPANIEWLGYMNPYRVTKVEILPDNMEKLPDVKLEIDGKPMTGEMVTLPRMTFESASSQEERAVILNICKMLKELKVGRVQKFEESNAFKETYRGTVILLDFENGKSQYAVGFSEDKISIGVDNIAYSLLYTQNDPVKSRALHDAINAFD